MARQLWVDYDELKHLTTQLGRIMLDESDRRPQVKKLCEQITAKVAAVRAAYDASAAVHTRAKVAIPQPIQRKALKCWLFGS